MNTKKRMLCVVIVSVLTVALFGCSTQDKDKENSSSEFPNTIDFIVESNDISATVSKTEEYQDAALMYVTGSDSVSVFKDSECQELLAELNCGDTVILAKENNGGEALTYVLIPDTNVNGYIYSNYLVSDKNSVTKPFSVVIGESGAEVFSSEGGTGDVTDIVFFGDTVDVLAKTSGGYWRVLTNKSVIGYVNVMLFKSDSLPTDTDEFDPYSNEDTQVSSIDDKSSVSSKELDRDIPDRDIKDTSSAESSNVSLDQAVSTVQTQVGGRWAATYIDLETGTSQSVGNAQMQAASLIKLYIMGAVYENYDTYASQEDSIDSLLYSMITVSDNYSANELVRILGSGNTDAGKSVVTAYAQSHGYYNTSMGRLLLESNINGDNYTSVDDCALFMQKVYNGELPHSSDMMSLLSQQTVTYKIPAGVPVRTANKTGELDSVQNDAAVVYADHPYVLCVMSENVPAGSAVSAIVELSASVYSSVSE